MKLKSEFNTLVLYPSSVCNLNCRYCYVAKNPSLSVIDNLLEESYADRDYYPEFISRFFPGNSQLKKLEFWGAEPFLHIDRVYKYGLLDHLINEHHMLSEFLTSTNMSTQDWIEQFFTLIGQFSRYPKAQFRFGLQVSIDGPRWVTDGNRGTGVYDKVNANWDRMISLLGDNLPPNMNLEVMLKETLDLTHLDSFKTEKDVMDYYVVLDDFVAKLHCKSFSNVRVYNSIPNIAVPPPATKEDGLKFSEMLGVFRLAHKHNLRDNVFRYYRQLLPFYFDRTTDAYRGNDMTNPPGMCGQGVSCIALMPRNMVSVCHQGFTEILDTFGKESKANEFKDSTIDTAILQSSDETKLAVSLDEFITLHDKLIQYYSTGTTAKIASAAIQIIVLAEMGDIDSQYKNAEEAIQAARWLLVKNPYCIRDNLKSTGTMTMLHNGLIRLFLNGAHKLLVEDMR